MIKTPNLKTLNVISFKETVTPSAEDGCSDRLFVYVYMHFMIIVLIRFNNSSNCLTVNVYIISYYFNLYDITRPSVETRLLHLQFSLFLSFVSNPSKPLTNYINYLVRENFFLYKSVWLLVHVHNCKLNSSPHSVAGYVSRSLMDSK